MSILRVAINVDHFPPVILLTSNVTPGDRGRSTQDHDPSSPVKTVLRFLFR